MSLQIVNSIVVPVYQNAESIAPLLARLEELSKSLESSCEVVFVVDGSPDNSFDILSDALQSFSLPAQLIRHSRNFGAFAAIRTGMIHARGDNVAVMAADLQEPPELVVEFFRILESGSADIVIGRREGRDDPTMTKASSTMFWRIYRKYVFPDMPDGGVDIFACSREVSDVVLALDESHSSLIGLLYWIGYRRVEVPYRRQERQHGVSGWSLKKKVRYLLDSVFSFTDIPLTVLVAVGAIGGIVTVIAGLVVFIAWLLGAVREPGYTPVMLVLLFSTFSLLTAHGIVGTYVWRAYENTKRRPSAIAMSRWKSEQGAR